MAKCDSCGTFIVFGGTREGKRRYCNKTCQQNGYLKVAADGLPQESVDLAVDEVHQGACPMCGGPGPVDVHSSHVVWSLVYLTSWKSTPHLCCRPCGRKKQIKGLCLSSVAGWWGFPWGLFMTPLQVFRNLSGMFGGPHPDLPSPQLEEIVRLDLAARAERGESLPGARPKRHSATAAVVDKIDVECAACGQKFKAKVELAGRSGSCRGCGAPITVPELDLVDDADLWESDDVFETDASAEVDDWNDTPPRRRGARAASGSRRAGREKKSSGLKIIAAVSVGILLCVGLILFAVFRRNPPIARNNPAPVIRQEPFVPERFSGAAPRLADGSEPNPQAFNPALADSQPGAANLGAPTLPDPADPVEPLPNAAPDGRLWIVLSNLREEARRGGNPFDRPFTVNYQVASGTPDPAAKYVLHVTRGRQLGSLVQYVDFPVPLQASGTMTFQVPPQFQPPGDIVVVIARALDRNKWQNLSGELKPGGDETVAQAPPTVREAAGADADGRTVAVANARVAADGPFTSLTVDFELISEIDPAGFYFVVAEAGGRQIEFDVSRTLKQATVGVESSLGGRLIGAGSQLAPPYSLRIEKRRSPIRSRLALPQNESETISNTLTVQ